MKVTIAQETLARALNTVGRAVKNNTPMPVLANVLMTVENGRLRFAATDLELVITCLVDATIEQPGATTVPAKTFSDLVATLTKEQVSLSLDEETQTLTVKSGRSKTQIKCLAAGEFPALPKANGSVFDLPASHLKEAILQVAPASADDESRPVLTAIHIRLAAGNLTLEAADGYRMSQTILKTGLTGTASALIPARSMEELARLAGAVAGEGSVKINFDRNRAIFSLGDVEIFSQLIEGAYPELDRIVPHSFKTRAVVATAALQKAVKQASIFARAGDTPSVVVEITPSNGVSGSVKLTGRSEETGQATAELEATVEGEAITIAFNPLYLAEALKTISTAQLALETNQATSPGVLRPEGGASSFHLLMPMHLGA